MIYNCAKCGLSKSDGAMGSVLPQCKCDWNLTAPPKQEWVGLTDEEIENIYAASKDVNYEYERAIEAKLKEKNNG